MNDSPYASCSCFSQTGKNERGGVPVMFHREIQDLRCQAWTRELSREEVMSGSVWPGSGREIDREPTR